jgi:phenylacetyl-CoA:acceptor oxidoreductase subunit 1
MVIDLRKCIGCGSCSVICDYTNKLSYNKVRRVFDCGLGSSPERLRTCLPLSCMHCSSPPCLDVCPTAATYQREDGIIDVDAELCIGCGTCVVACPYMARSIIFQDEYAAEVGELEGDGNAFPDRIGTCIKCNFCLPRIDAGLAKGISPGKDPEATPACVVNCSSKALHFGDLYDPESVVSLLVRENRTVHLQEELGTEPSVYYIFD